MLIIGQTKGVLINMKNLDSLYIEEKEFRECNGFELLTTTNPRLVLLRCKKRETAENFLEEIAKTFCEGKTKLLYIPEYISESEEE